VRDKTAATFDGAKLEKTFSDIEVFLSTFPEDERIREISIDLVVATFAAIEEAIGYYLKSDREPISRPIRTPT